MGVVVVFPQQHSVSDLLRKIDLYFTFLSYQDTIHAAVTVIITWYTLMYYI